MQAVRTIVPMVRLQILMPCVEAVNMIKGFIGVCGSGKNHRSTTLVAGLL